MDRPLADLHRHLDGSLRPATLRELAARAGREVPPDLLFEPGMGLGEALSRFEFVLSLLQEPAVVRRVAAEICEDAEADGVTTLEIRFAPHLHRAAPPGAVVDAALEACPTSNVHTGVIEAVGDHPLPRWLRRGVRACLCTDNTLLSDVTAREEHARMADHPEMSGELLARAVQHGHDAAFG